MTLEELQIKFTADTAGLKSELGGVKSSLKEIEPAAGGAEGALGKFAKVGGLIAGAAIGAKLLNIGKDAILMANDAVESEQLFEISMGGMADSTRKWSNGLSKSLGLNAVTIRKNTGVMNVMLNSMGLVPEKAHEMAMGLTELSEDMASFYNLDPSEMFNKLQSGITGMGMPLKQLGILIDDQTIKQYALENGIGQVGKEMTATEKVMARYGAIMQQTSMAQGDLARTLESPTNQLRILTNKLNEAKIAFGTALQPALIAILPVLTSVATGFSEMITAMSGFGSVEDNPMLGVSLSIEEATEKVDAVIGTSGKDMIANIEGLSAKTKAAVDALVETEKRSKKISIDIILDPPSTTGMERFRTAVDGIHHDILAYGAVVGKTIKAILDAQLEDKEITQAQYDAAIGKLNKRLANLNTAADKFTKTVEAKINAALIDGTVTDKELPKLKTDIEAEAAKAIKAIEKDLKAEEAIINAALKAGKIDATSAATTKADLQAAALAAIGEITVQIVKATAELGLIEFKDKTFTAEESKAIHDVIQDGVTASIGVIDAIVNEVNAVFDGTGKIGEAVNTLYAGLQTQVTGLNNELAAIMKKWMDGAAPNAEDWAKAMSIQQERAKLIEMMSGGLTSAGGMNLAFSGLSLDIGTITNYFTALKTALDTETSSLAANFETQKNILANAFGTDMFEPILEALGLGGLDLVDAIAELERQMGEKLIAMQNGAVMDAAKKLGPQIAAAIASGNPAEAMTAALALETFLASVDFSTLDDKSKAAVVDMIAQFENAQIGAALRKSLDEAILTMALANPEFFGLGAELMASLKLALETNAITPQLYNQIIVAAAKGELAKLIQDFRDAGDNAMADFILALLGGEPGVKAAAESVAQAAVNGVNSKLSLFALAGAAAAKAYADAFNAQLGPTVKNPNVPLNLPTPGLPSVNNPFNISPFPKFAAGGVFAPNKPFVGLLGDQLHGRNIETPENLLRDIVRSESGGGGGGMSAEVLRQAVSEAVDQVLNKVDLKLLVDGEQFGKMSIKTINNAQRMSGKVLLEI